MQAITASFSKLTEQLTQNWEEDYYDNEDDEGEEQELVEMVGEEPPAKKAKTSQGKAFDKMSQAVTPKKTPPAFKPGDVADGKLVQGLPQDPKVHGSPEFQLPVTDQNKEEVGATVLHALQQEIETEVVGNETDQELAQVNDQLFKTNLTEMIKLRMNAYGRLMWNDWLMSKSMLLCGMGLSLLRGPRT